MSFITDSNKLSNFTVHIDDLEIPQDDIRSVEVSFMHDSPVINAVLTMVDVYDISGYSNLKDGVFKIVYTDMFEATTDIKFTVIDISENYNEKQDRILVLALQDESSFKLNNEYSSRTISLPEYFKEKNIDVVSPDIKVNFPKNIDNLTFLTEELNRHGFRFFQNRDGFQLKSHSEMKPSVLELTDPDEFVTTNTNMLYKNRILDIEIRHLAKGESKPSTTAVAYDITTKSMKQHVTPVDYLNEESQLKQTGMFTHYQTTTNFNKFDLNYQADKNKDNTLLMVTNGYNKNQVNKIYNVKVHGLRSTQTSANYGNIKINGKWVASQVTDKIIGGGMIQKIILNKPGYINETL